eukprot:g10266.t1
MPTQTENASLKISLLSLHGLIRAEDAELGRDADTGGQVKYVLELAAELSRQPEVASVELLTRQIVDDSVDSAYALPEEPITDKAKIVRLPFGPNRYLRKETLWPYLEIFIDHALGHYRRTGLPDVIHGHYADAGLAGAQLARLLHIPYVFTGHSLGRVKRERLSQGRASAESLEKKYKFQTRIEAEEVALETAAMVVASTSQEVEQQYEIYEHYVPDRMEVIPPGVDLSAFRAPKADEPRPRYAAELARFLDDPDKPFILTMARPDERKNLEMLVRVYGESEQLQQAANLVMLMGSRDDLRTMEPAQQRILQNVLTLVDVYDLYGKMAYPKAHELSDVQELYRYATSCRGVFINPALTEPFGLTLLEAAASGLPIVATNDGGPRDIIANCRNGLLVDPLDPQEIEHSLLRVLTEPDEWETWSKTGLKGVEEHYSWTNHARRYLRDIQDILSHSAKPALEETPRRRRLPEFDRLIVTDLDNTLTGDADGLTEFLDRLKTAEHVGFGIATGRRLDDALQLVEELGLPMPDVFDTSCGTELHYGEKLTEDRSWRKQIGYHWKPDEVRKILDEQPGLFPQDEKEQSEFKISYEVDPDVAPKIAVIRRILREAGLRAKLVFSLGMYLDVIPVRGGSEMSMRHLLYKWGFAPEHVLVSGDSGNDEGMLKGSTLGVVVGNYSPELDRLRTWPELFELFFQLYGSRYDFFYHVEQILMTAARAWAQRPGELRHVDEHRINEPNWFESEKVTGGALYVDLFSENLNRLREHVPYFQELGLTYLHLMPLFAVRPGNNDGGYAISNYRSIDPRLGTIDDLKILSSELRAAGISLVLDFVFNHTADDHEWAQRAQSGDREYQDFYYIFPDRQLPDQYERTLREIFPTVRRGNFTWHDGMRSWIWTTFNSFQWDLNYRNPSVFRAMLDEMLFLANTGVDILRLDAVAFIWKQMGTMCENLPQAHWIIQAFNAVVRVAAPGLLFKSEAIVHPDDVADYISPQECQISYNPTLMALLWESLATREVKLLRQSLSHRHDLPENTTWVNYLRCHDDIGWTFDDADAAAVGINAYDHRQFLNAFYTGQFKGSFARGVPFQQNRATGDMRISGTLASLAGLELAIEEDDDNLKEMAVRRMTLLHGIVTSIGGIPLLYLGEEWGLLNDYDFVKDPAKAGDTRWIHRPKMKWEFLEELDDRIGSNNNGSIRLRIFQQLKQLIALRKAHSAFAGVDMDLMPADNPHVLGFVRDHEGSRIVVLANFSEEPQTMSGNHLRTAGLGRFFEDLISGATFATSSDIAVDSYQLLWLKRV